MFLQTSDYLVVYLRLVTSGQLQKEEDFYQNFLEGGKSMREFCQQVSTASWIERSLRTSNELICIPNIFRKLNPCIANPIICMP